jgi:spore germination protein KB
MIEKGKISSLQMAIIMHPTIFATAILMVPAITAKYAKQDLWLSLIWATVAGFLVVFIACQLNKLYPSETIIEYSSHIVGKAAGKIIGLIYIFFYLHINGIIIREYGEFVVGTFLNQTPISVVMGSMILVCAFAVYGGIEVIGRAAQIVVPVLTLFISVIIFMLLKDFDIQQIFPIMEEGLMPSFKGAIVPMGWLSEYMLISFILPYLNDRAKGMKWGIFSVLGVVILMMMTNLATYMVFGELTRTLIYPVLGAVRYISIADFLEHLEAIVMAIWVTGTFIKITMFFYAIVLGTAQWLNLSDFRTLILPVSLLLMIFAIWSTPNLQELAIFLGTTGSFYLIIIQLAVPFVLLVIAWLQKQFQKQKG